MEGNGIRMIQSVYANVLESIGKTVSIGQQAEQFEIEKHHDGTFTIIPQLANLNIGLFPPVRKNQVKFGRPDLDEQNMKTNRRI